MDFKNGNELLALCEEHHIKISEVMRQRECELGETTLVEIEEKMNEVWKVMKASARKAIKEPTKSMGGLIGGEAHLLSKHLSAGKQICGNILSRGMTYAMAVLEVNATMGVIVAAPTAGSSGIVPGLLLSLQEEHRLSDGSIMDALFNAGAIGYLAMRNATVAGAVGGCQAEVGVASAMAASAAVELLGGSPKQCLNAASTVLSRISLPIS